MKSNQEHQENDADKIKSDRNRPANTNKGSQYLVDKYNVNDQAHSDSSLKDFIPTTSGFHHADEVNPEPNFNENPGGTGEAD